MPGAIPFDRLVRKEVSLGLIREIAVPEDYIGLQLAPFMAVGSDDVTFDYIKNYLQEGMAPARAEDAEAELAQKDSIGSGSGRASIIDWAIKDKYTASDVTRYRENLLVQRTLQGAGVDLNLNDSSISVSDFQAKVARDAVRRRRTLDNRLEWLIMTSISTGAVSYNDGKIKFTVDWQRPTNQKAQAPQSYNGGPTALWTAGTTHDPIGNILWVQEWMDATYGVTFSRALISKRLANTIWLSNRFLAQTALVGGTPSAPIDPMYLRSGWSADVAMQQVEAVTGVKFQIYDGKYRSRAVGSTTLTQTRFTNENDIIFLPSDADLAEVDDTSIGFGKTLTSPHPEGNWSSGYYEWEDEQKDPWMNIRGSGIKAFPIFPYMQYSYVMRAGGFT